MCGRGDTRRISKTGKRYNYEKQIVLRRRVRRVKLGLTMISLLFSCAFVAATTTRAPDSFLINFNTNINGTGMVTVNITRSWAPIGADHLCAFPDRRFARA